MNWHAIAQRTSPKLRVRYRSNVTSPNSAWTGALLVRGSNFSLFLHRVGPTLHQSDSLYVGNRMYDYAIAMDLPLYLRFNYEVLETRLWAALSHWAKHNRNTLAFY